MHFSLNPVWLLVTLHTHLEDRKSTNTKKPSENNLKAKLLVDDSGQSSNRFINDLRVIASFDKEDT
jgi:hypothetical protein